MNKMMNLKGTKYIATIVIVALLLTTSMLTAAATNGRGEAQYEADLVLRSFGEGMSTDEIRTIRDNVLARARSRPPEGVFALAAPVIAEGTVVVAYGFMVRPDGVPSEYMAMTNSNESVESIHKQASEWLRRERVVRRASEIGQKDSSTTPDPDIAASVATASASWQEIGFFTRTMPQSPYGQFTNHSRVFRLINDGSAAHDFFAVRQWATTTPGIVAYNSTWRNDRQIPQQNWGWGQLGAEMIDRDPLGTISGSQTIGVSLAGGTEGASATLSWSYTQPNVTTNDLSILVPPRARWEQLFNTSASQTTSGGMEPGSAVRTIAPAAPGTYRLLEQRTDVRYRNPRLFGDDLREFAHVFQLSVVY
ncbi:MAG: hypothetical protein KGZ64_07405 [Thermaerobacter sp.]|nr:hypothetical protein [Thermaerobacter sp.]